MAFTDFVNTQSIISSQNIVKQLKQIIRGNKDVVHKPNSNTGKTTLHEVAEAGHDQAVSYLLKGPKVAVDAKDANGNTPLNSVIQSKGLFLHKKILVIKALYATGADPLTPNDLGQTPLMSLTALLASYPKDQFYQRRCIQELITVFKQGLYMELPEGMNLRFTDSNEALYTEIDDPKELAARYKQSGGAPFTPDFVEPSLLRYR